MLVSRRLILYPSGWISETKKYKTFFGQLWGDTGSFMSVRRIYKGFPIHASWRSKALSFFGFQSLLKSCCLRLLKDLFYAAAWLRRRKILLKLLAQTSTFHCNSSKNCVSKCCSSEAVTFPACAYRLMSKLCGCCILAAMVKAANRSRWTVRGLSSSICDSDILTKSKRENGWHGSGVKNPTSFNVLHE